MMHDTVVKMIYSSHNVNLRILGATDRMDRREIHCLI
jgi:hypothetical protein